MRLTAFGLCLCLGLLSACETTGGFGVGGLSNPQNAPPAADGSRRAEDGLMVGHRLLEAGEYELALKAYLRAASEQGINADVLSAIGSVAWVDDEALLDPVTAVSGSGPAYVFLLAELMEQAAIEQGIPADLARKLARETVSGSGALLAASPEDAAVLRKNVTSPGGTTAAALAVLMEQTAMPDALSRAIAAATARSRALAG